MTTTTATWTMTATTTADLSLLTSDCTAGWWMRRFAREARPAKPFRPQKIRRNFRHDWREVILTACEEIKGDAPPQRLQPLRRALIRELRATLRKHAADLSPTVDGAGELKVAAAENRNVSDGSGAKH